MWCGDCNCNVDEWMNVNVWIEGNNDEYVDVDIDVLMWW